MHHETNESRARQCIAAVCAGTAGMSVAALVGWQLRVDTLRTFGAGRVAMNPLTALCFLGLAVSVFGMLHHAGSTAWRRSGALLGLGVAFLGAGRLLALGGPDLGIDRLLYADQLARESIPNRMAPNTAACFLLMGVGLALARCQGARGRSMAQVTALVTLALALLALIGYAYRLRPLYGVGAYIPMALNTAVCFLFTSIAALLLQPERGLGRLLLAPTSGGVIARRLLPLSILAPLATGALSLELHRRGVYDAGWAIGGATLVVISTLIALTWITGGAVDRADRRRRAAELEQQRALEQARLLTEEVRAQKSRLEFMNKELESFSYSVSHDLRAPLRHIGGFAELLVRFNTAQLDEKGQRRLSSISGAVVQMGQLIDDLLAFSRMARSELNHRAVDMKRIANAICGEAVVEGEARPVDWVVHELPEVLGDESMLRLVLGNLVSNALKYSGTRAEARIEIGWQRAATAGEKIFFVRDNGVGFDMAYSHKLFGVFQRLHPQSEFPGTGIGLANVRRIVMRHGGRVWAESAPNEGATFYFSLPDAPVEEPESWAA